MARLLAVLIIAVPVVIILGFFVRWLRKKIVRDKIEEDRLRKGGQK